MMRYEILLIVLQLLNQLLELTARLWPYWPILY